MAIQTIPSLLPCLKATDLRSLGGGLKVGESVDEGDVADGTDIVAGARYVVSGSPSNGTIAYASSPRAIGATFLGASGQTTFSRSTSTVRLNRVKTASTAVSGIKDSYYIVSGGSNDSVNYPTGGAEYSAGQVFRGNVGGRMEINNNAVVYEIEDAGKIITLAQHKIGSRTVSGVVDNYSALGLGDRNGVAVNASSLSMIALWNFGQASADVLLKSYIPPLDNATGAERRDVNIELPTGGNPYVFWPTESFRQGGATNSFGERAEDRELTQNSFVFQTSDSNKDVWIVPILTTSAGFQ